MRTQSEAEMQRSAVASEEFKDCFCSWWPPPYKALLPVTFDGALLMKAKQHIEQAMKAHYEAYTAEQQNPWDRVGPEPKWIDWSDYSGTERFVRGFERPMGMPAWPKQGFDKHPDVEAAWADSHRTAEYVAFVKAQRAKRAWQAATHEWVEAANSAADEATLQKLKDKETAAAKAHADAEQSYESLGRNPARGLKIVRDALTIDDRVAEQNSISCERPKAADGGRERTQ
jgi:hypothetical protein